MRREWKIDMKARVASQWQTKETSLPRCHEASILQQAGKKPKKRGRQGKAPNFDLQMWGNVIYVLPCARSDGSLTESAFFLFGPIRLTNCLAACLISLLRQN